MKYLLIISISLLVSCKKSTNNFDVACNNPTKDSVLSQHLFQGNWEWVSEYYIPPLTGVSVNKTPQSEGYTRQLVFKDYLELEFYKNNLIANKYKYGINKESTITLIPTDNSNVFIFKEYASGNYYDYVHFDVCNDTLTLNFQITTDIKGREKWVKK